MDFSLVIPAFNEKDRLPKFFLSLVDALGRINLKGEIIIVDDGSRNQDYQSYLTLQKTENIPIVILRHQRNLGKGAAIQTGFKVAKGAWVGFVDADGAISSKEVVRLLEKASSSMELDGVFGSRILMLGYEINRKFIRHLFGRIFSTLTYLFFRIPIYDSQCGCKFFRKSKISPLVELCQEKQYLFDIELIALGYLKRLNFLEVPISWKDIPDSKLHFIKDGLKMLIGLWRIRKHLLSIK